jgi:PilZ domain
MAQDSGENRKFKRYEVDSVHGKMTYLSNINILNISMDGAAIATTQRLSLDREYALKLNYEKRSLTLRGKIVWSVLSHSKTLKDGEVVPVYKAGVKFTNVLTDEATDLIAYIEKSRINDKEQRVLGVRFKVSQPSNAGISMPSEYTIKKISLSGMLIAADIAHEIDSEHEMEIHLDGIPITVVGRIVNVAEVKGEDASQYDIGVEFVKIPEAEMKILSSYIDARETEQ